jgi:hypothetical protein
MTDHLKRASRFFALIALVPLIIGFIGAWSAGFGFLLFILGVPAALVTLMVGAILWLFRGAKLPLPTGRIRERALAVIIAPVLLAGTLMAALPLLKTGSFVGSFTRLMVNRGHYEKIISKARKARQPAWFEDDNGVTYSTDLGPPVRIAFNPAGMLDNWSGIIYDPTGDVMLAKGFDPKTGKFFAPDRVTKLFNGDLVGCRQLWGDYYDCSFT